MNSQPLWRASFTVCEQLNGYYEVTTSERFEHGDQGPQEKYPNLSWTEVEQLVDDVALQWDATRSTARVFRIFLDDSLQLGLFD